MKRRSVLGMTLICMLALTGCLGGDGTEKNEVDDDKVCGAKIPAK